VVWLQDDGVEIRTMVHGASVDARSETESDAGQLEPPGSFWAQPLEHYLLASLKEARRLLIFRSALEVGILKIQWEKGHAALFPDRIVCPRQLATR
jgi:hypothetical protein